MAHIRYPKAKGKSAARLGSEVMPSVGVAVKGPSEVAKMLKAAEPTEEVWGRLQEVFRPKDLSQVLPREASKVPPSVVGRVRATQDLAFMEYLDQIAKLFGQR